MSAAHKSTGTGTVTATRSSSESSRLSTKSQDPEKEAAADLERANHELPVTENALINQLPEKQAQGGPQRTIHGLRWFWVCCAIYITAFLYGLDTTIAADVQGAVVETFGSVDQLTWIGTGFPLGSVTVILLLGSLYSKFEIKWLFLASIVIFEVGSAICGAAPNMNALIVGRVIAGIGGSGIYMGGLNYMTLMTAVNERGTYIAGIGLIWGLGCILGPVIGGAFSSSAATWRWAFYINLPIAAIFIPVYFLYLPSISLQGDKPIRTRLASIDFLGNALFVATLSSFTIVLTFAGTLWAWNSAASIAVWVVFGVLLIVTVLQQYFRILVPREPFFPAYLLRSPTQVLLFLAMAASSASLFIPTYYIPIFFQFTNGDSPIQAAVRLLPFVLVLIFVNMLSGALLPKIGYYWVIFFTGGVFILIGGALLVTINVSTPIANIYGYTVLSAIGTGATIQLAYTVGSIRRMLEGHAEDIPDVISLQNVAQLGATLLSLLFAGQIFQSYAYNNLGAALAGQGYTDVELRSAVAGAQSTVFESLSPDLRAAAVGAIVSALQRIWILPLVAGVVVLVSSLFLKKERLVGVEPVAA